MKALIQRAQQALAEKTTGSWRWSSTVKDYYPVDPKARWGHGSPPNPHVLRALTERSGAIAEMLRRLALHAPMLATIPDDADPALPLAPYWQNSWFHSLDAAVLTCLVAEVKPQRYIEIGSGFSTKFTRHALRHVGAEAHMTSIDPRPRAEIDQLCDVIVRCALEDCDPGIFDSLEKGDVLFFDGSHRVFQNSDVTVFFLEVLPRLKPGILVHIHDIFLPDDYAPRWSKRLYSEQYILAAMLLCGQMPFKVVLPNYFVAQNNELAAAAMEIFRNPAVGLLPLPFLRNGKMPSGSSFWVETT